MNTEEDRAPELPERPAPNPTRDYVHITFHLQPDPEGLEPWVSIYMGRGGKFHHRAPGAASVGRVLLASLNAIGAVRTKEGGL